MCSDTELIVASRGGDNDALQKLATKYMGFASEKAKGFVSSPIEYDDIVQEAMLGFLSAYYTYDINADASFKTYASVCMNNRIISGINSLERKKRIPREMIVGLDEVVCDSSQEDPETMFFRRQKTEEIIRRIRQELSKREKTILFMFMSGYKYDEIAKKLSTSRKSVDNALQRIRKKLRESDQKAP